MPIIKLDNHVSDDTIGSLGLKNTSRYYSYYDIMMYNMDFMHYYSNNQVNL